MIMMDIQGTYEVMLMPTCRLHEQENSSRLSSLPENRGDASCRHYTSTCSGNDVRNAINELSRRKEWRIPLLRREEKKAS
jgi:hypothetical protein